MALNQGAFEFDHGTNARFGFVYDFPRGWNISESMNADGSTFTNPSVPGVEIRVYGSHVMEADDLDELVGLVLAAEEKRAGFELLDQQPERCRVEGKDGREESVPARTLTYCYGSERGRVAEILMLAQVSDVQFGVQCHAPHSEFRKFQPLFESVIRSFKALRRV